jgi:hypothetical protein|nr:MAG TPA: hypothetical protein [Caudoviricetes sp.]
MKNITRTVTDYIITAYDLVDGEDGPEVSVVAQATCLAVSMTKSEARAALAEAIGAKIPKGLTIKWEPQATFTYAMPLDKFIENAVVIKEGE